MNFQTNQKQLISNQTLITQENSQEVQVDLTKKRFIARAFGPILPGAMRGSIFALLASAMGTGMFNLPYRVNQVGIIFYILFILVGGLFSYYGMYFISRLILKFKVQSYSQMSQRAYGKGFRKLAQFCLIIYPWGITVCFQVILAKFVVQLLYDVFNVELYDSSKDRQNDIYNNMGNLVRIAVTGGAIIINLLFILKKQIGILQKISIIGVLSATINVAIVTVTLFIGFNVDSQDQKGTPIHIQYDGITAIDWSKLKWFNFDGWNAFSWQVQGLASVIFCYVNHQLCFPLAFDLRNPTKRRLDKIFNRVHITEIILYNLVGLAGYLLLLQHIDKRDIAPVVMSSITTTTMAIGKTLMLAALFFAVPLNLFPARQVIYQTFTLQNNNKNHIILSLILAFSGTAIAILFQKVNSYFGLLGGTAGVMMAGAIPAICYIKLMGQINTKDKIILLFVGIVSFFGVLGAILSVIVPS